MPAASFIAKLGNMNPILSGGILNTVNAFFNDGGDEIFKKTVVDKFLFRYRGGIIFFSPIFVVIFSRFFLVS